MASGKVGVTVGAGGITSSSWIDMVSPAYQGLVSVAGFVVVVSVIAVNVQLFFLRRKTRCEGRRLTALDTAIKEQQARDMGLDPDTI